MQSESKSPRVKQATRNQDAANMRQDSSLAPEWVGKLRATKSAAWPRYLRTSLPWQLVRFAVIKPEDDPDHRPQPPAPPLIRTRIPRG